MHVSSPPDDWQWQGTDNLTVKDSRGNKVRTTKYRYDTGSRSYTIWVSEYGIVDKVSITDYNKPGSSKKKVHSPLDPSDFVHPEDFYDWYSDDFYDYEEAEDYYYSHGGK